MPFNDSYANDILNYAFAKTAKLTAPTSVYIGLCSNDPEADGGTFTELSGNGYSRVLISLKDGTYPNVIGYASGRMIQNTKQINWTKATGDWGDANGFGLFSAGTDGTPFFYGKFEEPVSVSAGSVALFDPYAFKITFPEEDVAEEAAEETTE